MEIATERRGAELAYLAGSLGKDGYAVIDNGSWLFNIRLPDVSLFSTLDGRH